MATRTVVCPECAEPLPYGRLACPSCGALLASVAGAGRRIDLPVADEVAEEPLLAPEEDPSPEPAADAPAPPPTWPEPPEIPSVLGEWTGPDWSDGVDESPGADHVEETPVESAVAAEEPAAEVAGVADIEEPYVPAGAYMPPSAVLAPEVSAAPLSAAASSAAASSAAGPSAVSSARPRRPGSAPLLADLPLDAPDDLPGWLVVAGAAAGAIGFFLPWAHRVIGASGDGYLSSWGFGALMNVPIFIAVFVTLVLAVMPTRVPAWLRTSVLPLVVGGLVIGTVWPYVLYGPLNGRLGSVIEVFAGLLLVFGGVLALRAVRHAGAPPSV
jgi:hypothetical protein